MTKMNLSGFTGSENWYRHSMLRSITYTDGVKYVADTAGAYWLIDEVVLIQIDPKYQDEPFQEWHLEVSGSKAVLTCSDGNGRLISTKLIPITDFPEPGIKFWFIDKVVLLPSEY